HGEDLHPAADALDALALGLKPDVAFRDPLRQLARVEACTVVANLEADPPVGLGERDRNLSCVRVLRSVGQGLTGRQEQHALVGLAARVPEIEPDVEPAPP